MESLRTFVELFASAETAGSPKNPTGIHFSSDLFGNCTSSRFLVRIRLAASFKEPELVLVQVFRTVLLHQKCRRDAEAEQHDLIKIWNGESCALL